MQRFQDSVVLVTGRGLFSVDPARLSWGSKQWRLTGWAGPWPVDERWWTAQATVVARAQVRLDGENARALLLVFDSGVWRAEGIYD